MSQTNDEFLQWRVYKELIRAMQLTAPDNSSTETLARARQRVSAAMRVIVPYNSEDPNDQQDHDDIETRALHFFRLFPEVYPREYDTITTSDKAAHAAARLNEFLLQNSELIDQLLVSIDKHNELNEKEDDSKFIHIVDGKSCDACTIPGKSSNQREICAYLTNRFAPTWIADKMAAQFAHHYTRKQRDGQPEYMNQEQASATAIARLRLHYFDPIHDCNLPFATLEQVKSVYETCVSVGFSACWSDNSMRNWSKVRDLMIGRSKFKFDQRSSIVMRHDPTKCELHRLLIHYSDRDVDHQHVRCIRPSHLVPGSYQYNANDRQFRERMEHDPVYNSHVLAMQQYIIDQFTEYRQKADETPQKKKKQARAPAPPLLPQQQAEQEKIVEEEQDEVEEEEKEVESPIPRNEGEISDAQLVVAMDKLDMQMNKSKRENSKK